MVSAEQKVFHLKINRIAKKEKISRFDFDGQMESNNFGPLKSIPQKRIRFFTAAYAYNDGCLGDWE